MTTNKVFLKALFVIAYLAIVALGGVALSPILGTYPKAILAMVLILLLLKKLFPKSLGILI